MRYDLTGFEWSVIEPLLPKNRHGGSLRTIDVFSTPSPGFALAHRGAIFPNGMDLTPRPMAQDPYLGRLDGRHRQAPRR